MVDTMNAMDITYCEGARLLQDSQADIGSILIQRPNGGLICQHCYLVVADARDVRAIAPDQDWSLLVSCHVQACGSLHDRRAAYSCYACLERGKASVETSMAELKEHLQTCELIRDIKLSAQGKRQGDMRPAPPASRRSGKKPAIDPESTAAWETTNPRRQPARTEAAQGPKSVQNLPSDPFRQAPDTPATPVQKSQSRAEASFEPTPALPSRPRPGAPTNAERTYTPPTVRRHERPPPANTARPNPADMYNIPGGFPEPGVAASDSRASSLFQDYSPTVPRRKEVRMEAAGPSQVSSDSKPFPAPPNRAAPPPPPVLSPPAPPPYYQGKEAPKQTPTSAYDLHNESFAGVDQAKVQQLVSLGIPRLDAEYLLNRTGGDINAAAELQLSEMGSLGGPARENSSQPMQPGSFPSPLGSNPVDRRNRRSK